MTVRRDSRFQLKGHRRDRQRQQYRAFSPAGDVWSPYEVQRMVRETLIGENVAVR
jgi:hypothetical protein